MTKAVFRSTTAGHPAQASDWTRDYVSERPAGDVVFREGELGTEMFIIQEGEVEIWQRGDGGDLHIATLERGDFFGEMSLLEELPRSATARVGESGARLLRIDGSTFDRMLHDNPEIAVRMMRKLSRRLRHTDERLREALGERFRDGTVLAGRESPPTPTGTEALVHEASGLEFALASGSETTIGRRDPVTGIYPDVDLAPVDPQRSVSRRHAKIYRRGGKFFLSEEIGNMNGTFVGDVKLETGVPYELTPGDTLKVGLVEVRFRPEP